MRFTKKALALGALAAFTLSGCSVEVSVPQDRVETVAAETLAKQMNKPVPQIDCPKDLKGEVGTTMKCTLSAGGSQIGVTITVTSVEGSTVNFDAKVDSKVAG